MWNYMKSVSVTPGECSCREDTSDQGVRSRRSCSCCQYLGEHWLAMLGDHGALVAVQ